ncbi:MAG: flagellar export protein FliJ [Gammaproteobacteria bacterium]
MDRSHRLKSVVEYRVFLEKKAREDLAGCIKKSEQIGYSLEGLNRYRFEYLEKCRLAGIDGIAMRQLLEFRHFIDKLDKAISEQKQLLQRLESELAAKRKCWEQASRKAKSLLKLQEMTEERLIAGENCREQFEQDENAANILARKMLD